MRTVTTCFGASAFGTARMFSKSVSPAEGRKVSLDRPECDCCSDDALGVNGAEIATVETRRMLGEQEQFAASEGAAASPRERRSTLGHGAGSRAALYEHVGTEPANAVDCAGGDWLEQQG